MNFDKILQKPFLISVLYLTSFYLVLLFFCWDMFKIYLTVIPEITLKK